MKCYGLFILLLATFFVPAAQAQERPSVPTPEPLLPRHLVQSQRVRSHAAALTKNEDAQLEKRTTLTWDLEGATGWINDTQTVYTYDEEGYVDDATSFTWNGTTWVETDRTDYAHANGMLEFERHDEWTGTAWQIVDLYGYEYTDGVLTKMTIQNWENGTWVDSEETQYTYTPAATAGSITGGTTRVWVDDEWVPTEKFTLTQSVDTVVYHAYAWDGTDWINAERVVYPGITLQDLYEHTLELVNSSPEYVGVILNLRLPDAVHEAWFGAEWVKTERNETVTWYDVFSGLPMKTETTFDTWVDDVWVSESRLETNYETVGDESRPDTTRFQFFDEGTWTTVMEETYLYTTSGPLYRIYQQINLGGGLQNAAMTQLEWKGVGTDTDDEEPLPAHYALDPAYPNPFNPSTQLTYHLAASGRVAIRVYDALGRMVTTLFDGPQTAGPHRVTFEATALPSGVYMVRLEAPGHMQTRAVTLLK